MAPFVGCAFFPTTSVAALTTWDFDADNEHGWTTIQGEAFLAGNGVTAGQLNGEGGRAGDAGWRGGVNNGATRNSHDGAHSTMIFRSPVINFANASATGSVLEIDWFGGEGKGGNVTMDPTSPASIVAGQTSGGEDGVKGMGLLNLTTGNYDAYSYKNGNGGTEVHAFTLAQLTEAGVSLTDSYQLDFFESDDGGWGWTRLEEVRIDPLALGENSSSSFVITDIDYSLSDQQLTLTWNSREGQIYVVKYSEDMINWDGDLDDSIDADAGEQTTRTFSLRGAGFSNRVFFRVERQPRG